MKNIGIVMPSSKNGGVFQLALSIAESLINADGKNKYYLIYYDSEDKNLFLSILNGCSGSIAVPCRRFSLIRKIIHFFGMIFGFDFMLIKYFYYIFKENNTNFLFYPTPSSLDFFPYKIPFVSFIPDLMHKYYPNFPEYRIDKRISRDITYGYFAKHSVLNLVDSEMGLNDLHKFFSISKDKIVPVPYIPLKYIYESKNMEEKEAGRILEKFSLPNKFIFYPAQFWFHKNHLRLMKALKIIKEDMGQNVNIVLSGHADANNKSYKKVMDFVKKAGLENQVFPLGYVAEREIVALYKKSSALVFPSLGGPTNIPIAEAIILGTPIACSNLFAMPEQAGEAGILFNPFSEKDMAEKIYEIWTDKNLRNKLVENCKTMAERNTMEHFANNLQNVINEAWKKVAK